ncbi:unnamed protein product [Brachionus calyciflorus]|uniref:Uncharacterized protein n=1 Tax=Brachionus calyciflorus TaxID=104777 RepID=A0A813YTK0_9BILA|nr:unnamed protein product [Brachionus calyciflorus]
MNDIPKKRSSNVSGAFQEKTMVLSQSVMNNVDEKAIKTENGIRLIAFKNSKEFGELLNEQNVEMKDEIESKNKTKTLSSGGNLKKTPFRRCENYAECNGLGNVDTNRQRHYEEINEERTESDSETKILNINQYSQNFVKNYGYDEKNENSGHDSVKNVKSLKPLEQSVQENEEIYFSGKSSQSAQLSVRKKEIFDSDKNTMIFTPSELSKFTNTVPNIQEIKFSSKDSVLFDDFDFIKQELKVPSSVQNKKI